jgi:hypothetical protein
LGRCGKVCGLELAESRRHACFYFFEMRKRHGAYNGDSSPTNGFAKQMPRSR